MVVALLVVPPATAFLWTKDIKSLIKLTIGIGIGISVLGYYLAFWADSSIAGMMVTVGGAVFLISAVLTSKKFKFRLGTQPNQEAFNS